MTPKGFMFSAMKAPIKKWNKEDIGIIISNRPCSAAAVFTSNRIKAAPVLVDMEHIRHKTHRAVICNSGNANAVTGSIGMKNARLTVESLASELGIDARETLIASTGVIGVQMPMYQVLTAIPVLVRTLEMDPAGFTRAIMTTDTRPKVASATVSLNNRRIKVWGTAKGAGMIHPNMATMLAFIVTDADVPKAVLSAATREAAETTFNRITIDGDTSTNDTLLVMANGAAGNAPLKKGSPGYKKFLEALTEVCRGLSEKIVSDGEGVTRFAEIRVEKAATVKEALTVARAVAGSLLVKTALHGGDPNWGRIICAVGNSGVPVVAEKLELYFGPHLVYKDGLPTDISEEKLVKEVNKTKVVIRLVLNRGKVRESYLFSDLSRKYVEINAEYRT